MAPGCSGIRARAVQKGTSLKIKRQLVRLLVCTDPKMKDTVGPLPHAHTHTTFLLSGEKGEELYEVIKAPTNMCL